MTKLLTIFINIALMSDWWEYGDDSVAGRKLSEVGAKCDQSKQQMSIIFNDTIIPNDKLITASKICEAANNFSELLTQGQIEAGELAAGENTEACKALKEMISIAGSYKIVLEDIKNRFHENPTKENADIILSATTCHMSKEERANLSKQIASLSILQSIRLAQ